MPAPGLLLPWKWFQMAGRGRILSLPGGVPALLHRLQQGEGEGPRVSVEDRTSAEAPRGGLHVEVPWRTADDSSSAWPSPTASTWPSPTGRAAVFLSW